MTTHAIRRRAAKAKMAQMLGIPPTKLQWSHNRLCRTDNGQVISHSPFIRKTKKAKKSKKEKTSCAKRRARKKIIWIRKRIKRATALSMGIDISKLAWVNGCLIHTGFGEPISRVRRIPK
jgi:hypothetical protein